MENKNILLECESGISGDMFVAALLDLGMEQKDLQKGLETALQSLPLPGFTIRISRVKKAGIDCCDFDVIVDKEHEHHDHDMAYLFGHLERDLEERHEHHGRTYLEIKEIIQKGTLSEKTKELALRIFERICKQGGYHNDTAVPDTECDIFPVSSVPYSDNNKGYQRCDTDRHYLCGLHTKMLFKAL